MESIPQEILDRITSNLNIGDTVKACAAKSSVAVEDRVDPRRYLREAFTHPDYLMACMTDVGCVISGSRALEYFEPGSTAETSDWDFLIHSDLLSLLYMLSALEYSGVTWDIDTEKFTRLMDGKQGHTETLFTYELQRAYMYCDGRNEMPAMENVARVPVRDKDEENLIRCIYAKYRDLITAEPHSGVRRPRDTITVTRTAVSYGHNAVDAAFHVELGDVTKNSVFDGYRWDEDFGSILRGRTSDSTGNQTVQLIVCSPKRGFRSSTCETPMERITSFYASHVQCFISGWCAVQLFPKESSERTAFLWTDPIADPTVGPAIEKYESRGFTFMDWQTPYKFPVDRITVGNGKALFVSFEDMYAETLGDRFDTRGLFEELTAGIEMLSWYVNAGEKFTMITDGELKQMRGIMRAHDELPKVTYISDFFTAKHLGSPHIEGNVARVRRMLRSGNVVIPVLRRYYSYLL